MDVGFVGVGAMGAAMAGHCANAGLSVTAFDTDADALADATGGAVSAAGELADIARASDVVIAVVITDDQSRAVVRGLLEAGPRPGLVVVIAATNHPRYDDRTCDRVRGTGLQPRGCAGLLRASGRQARQPHIALRRVCGGRGADPTRPHELQPQRRASGADRLRTARQGVQQHDALGGLRRELRDAGAGESLRNSTRRRCARHF